MLIKIIFTNKWHLSYFLKVLPHGEDPLRLPASNQMLRHLILKKVAMHPNELPGVVLLLRSYPELENLTVIVDDVKQIEVSELCRLINFITDIYTFLFFWVALVQLLKFVIFSMVRAILTHLTIDLQILLLFGPHN